MQARLLTRRGRAPSRGRLGTQWPWPLRQFGSECAGGPKVQSRAGAGCFWLEKEQPEGRRGGGVCQRRGAPGSSAYPQAARPHFARRNQLPAPGALAGPDRCQPAGSPPPRGGRSECRLLGDPALARPRRPEQAGEAAASAPGARGDSSGVLRDHPRKRRPQEAGQRDFLGKPGGPSRGWGHPHISIRIQEGGARGTDCEPTSHDLVLRGGGGVPWGWGLNSERRRRPAARLSSGSAPSRPDTDSAEFRGCPRRRPHPRPPQGRLS